METKHTPGPWNCKPSSQHDMLYLVYNKEGNFLTTDDEEHEANARLIEAAPDNYAANIAALKYLCDENPSSDDLLPVIETLQDAIAKAKGI